MKEKIYTVKCPNCKFQFGTINKAAICTVCGNVAVCDPLDGAFEEAVQGEEIVIKDKPKEKKADDTTNRAADDGGRVM